MNKFPRVPPPAELTKTVLDMKPPRFDVGGNRITGEHDQEVTPASGITAEQCVFDAGESPREPQWTFDEFGGYFGIGVGIGMILFGIGWLIIGG